MPEGVQTGGELLLEMRYALLDAFQEVFGVELQVRRKPRWCKRRSCPQLTHKHCVVLQQLARGQGPSLCCLPAALNPKKPCPALLPCLHLQEANAAADLPGAAELLQSPAMESSIVRGAAHA